MPMPIESWGEGDVKRLGSLPVVREVLRKLGVGRIVDDLCPIRDIADHTHGQVIETLIANRLTSPQPLYSIEAWAEDWAAPEIFGIPADKLNDDRLGRALDAVADQVTAIYGSVAVNAMVRYAISSKQIHVDATSLMFEGHYAENDPEHPQIARGYNADEDYKRKQVRTTFGSTSDGGIPLVHQAFDGNKTDTTTLMQTVESLRAVLRGAGLPDDVLFVGDSKLLAKGNLAKFLQMGDAGFVGPLERDKVLERELAALDQDAWKELDYASESELARRKKLPEAEWNRFWAQEMPWSVKDPQGKEHALRKIFIRSEEEQRAARKHRERQMRLAEEDFVRLQNGIPRYYPTEEKVRQRAAIIQRDRRVTGLYQIEIGTDRGRPSFRWSVDSQAIEREERLRGRYVLATNLPPERTASQVLAIQKEQYRAEQRFAHWKGPLQVRPLFLKDNGRIAALVLVTALALMVYTIIERQVRLQMTDQDGYARGFLPENRRGRPTAPTIFKAMDKALAWVNPLELRILSVANVRGTARALYELFGVTPEGLLGV